MSSAVVFFRSRETISYLKFFVNRIRRHSGFRFRGVVDLKIYFKKTKKKTFLHATLWITRRRVTYLLSASRQGLVFSLLTNSSILYTLLRQKWVSASECSVLKRNLDLFQNSTDSSRKYFCSLFRVHVFSTFLFKRTRKTCVLYFQLYVEVNHKVFGSISQLEKFVTFAHYIL